jgi:5-methylcytosine-specific restriction endonuclease McrA
MLGSDRGRGSSLSHIAQWAGAMNHTISKRAQTRLEEENYRELRKQILQRDGWCCQLCGSMINLEVHHQLLRSHSGEEQNLLIIFDSWAMCLNIATPAPKSAVAIVTLPRGAS